MAFNSRLSETVIPTVSHRFWSHPNHFNAYALWGLLWLP
jgi:hypothetical protein